MYCADRHSNSYGSGRHKNTLHFDASGEFIASFNRENLFIQIVPKSNPLDQTIKFIKKFPDQSGIIYCFTRKQVDDLSSILNKMAFSKTLPCRPV